jgi:hypothetical protein
MALDYIILDTDEIQITIDPPTIVPALMAPVPLQASGFSTVNNMKVCVVGDELPPTLQAPLAYTSGAFSTPGMGTVSVTLAQANKTQSAKDQDKVMILKGQTFQAKFTVSSPAIQPGPSPVPDPVATKTGTAQFITKNTIAQAE